ncbi:MAG: VWA domain-containing protein [Myxococcaceae bacterium]
MNRTTVFLAMAAVLLLVSVLLGLPRTTAPAPTPPPPPQVVVTPPPPPEPPKPAPATKPGSLSLTGRLSHPYLVPGTSDVFASLEVSAVDVPGSKRAPVNLAVVIDRSGSMSGAKIINARNAASRLVDLLDENDRLSIVHYGTDVSSMGGVFCTPENKVKLHRYIANISDEGGTNIGDGLLVGEKHISRAANDFRVNRVLLLSDGQPTVGITTAQGLANVVRTIRGRGVSVTSLGVGADFNEDLMQRLADVGGGSYGFISDTNPSAMATLFEKDLQQAGTMVARTAALSFELPPGVGFVEVYGRPVSQSGSTVTISLPDFSARQVEKLVVHLTASPAVRSGAMDISTFKLAYVDLLANGDANERLSLSAMVTEDNTLAMNNRDKQAVVAATKARAALNYKKAADALDRGDWASANKSLKDNEAIFFEADEVAGQGSVADERQMNSGLFGLSTAAPTAAPQMRREAVKKMKTESLRSSGRGDSVY